MKRRGTRVSLEQKFPPSDPCGCIICTSYCARPGWWTVAEAQRAIGAGYGGRMMMELSPDRALAVLSPAFRGCEGFFALQEFSLFGCTFHKNGLCELHGTGFQPLECRFCHHARAGLGPECHADIQKDWERSAGQALAAAWAGERGLRAQYRSIIKTR